MSHFTVLVVTPQEPTDDVLSAALQPFHEFECTGIKDEHVVFLDLTDEVREEYETGTKTGYIGPDGKVYQGYEEDIFYRPATAEEMQKIGPIGGIGFVQGFSYMTRYERKLLTVYDPNYNPAVPVSPGPRAFPRDWRLATDEERQTIIDAHGIDYDESGEVNGLRWKVVKQRLPEPVTLVREVPPGYEEREFPYSTFYPTLSNFAQEYHSYIVTEDGRIGRETNAKKWLWIDAAGRELGRTVGDAMPPGVHDEGNDLYRSDDPDAKNPIRRVLVGGSKWDWWVVGGRWAGSLLVRADANNEGRFETLLQMAGSVTPSRNGSPDTKKVRNLIDAAITARKNGAIGPVEVRGLLTILKRNGVDEAQLESYRTQLMSIEPAPAPAVKADRCMMRDLDMFTIRKQAVSDAEERYALFESIAQGRVLPSFKDILAQCNDDVQQAREIYWSTPVIKDLMASKHFSPFNINSYAVSREEFIRRAARDAFVFHAVLIDGRWYEAGRMGMFGVVHDEQDEDVWATQFNKIIETIPPDHHIAVIDCHI